MSFQIALFEQIFPSCDVPKMPPQNQQQQVQQHDESQFGTSISDHDMRFSQNGTGGGSCARSDPTRPCFLELPGEIRNLIYEQVVRTNAEELNNEYEHGCINRTHFLEDYQGILHVNRQIYREASSWFWNRNCVIAHNGMLSLKSFLGAVGPKNASYIRGVCFFDSFGESLTGKRRMRQLWRISHTAEACSDVITSFKNLAAISFEWADPFVGVEYAAHCIFLTIRRWMDTFDTRDDLLEALEGRIKVITWFPWRRHAWSDDSHKVIPLVRKLVDWVPVSRPLRYAMPVDNRRSSL